jgi:hypothetical protein
MFKKEISANGNYFVNNSLKCRCDAVGFCIFLLFACAHNPSLLFLHLLSTPAAPNQFKLGVTSSLTKHRRRSQAAPEERARTAKSRGLPSTLQAAKRTEICVCVARPRRKPSCKRQAVSPRLKLIPSILPTLKPPPYLLLVFSSFLLLRFLSILVFFVCFFSPFLAHVKRSLQY